MTGWGLREQVRGVEGLRAFGASLITPYVAPKPRKIGSAREAELEAEVAALKV